MKKIFLLLFLLIISRNNSEVNAQSLVSSVERGRNSYAYESLPTCNSAMRNVTVNLTNKNLAPYTCTKLPDNTYTWVDETGGVYELERFGGGSAASAATNDAALSAIIAAIGSAGKNTAIILPDGENIFSSSFTLPRGVVIRGKSGAQGSTPGQGCTITHNSNNSLFTWDGTGGSAIGTGGGVRDILITKGDGYSGGTAIKFLATSDSQRPGEMVIDNVLISGAGAGQWAIGFHADGTAANTAGTRGVRSIHFRKFRVANVSTNNKYIWLNQVTHVFGDVQLDSGSGSGTLGATIEGFWDDIMLRVSGGNISMTHSGIPGTDLATISLDVNIANLTNSYASTVGSIKGSISGTITNSSTFLGIINKGSGILRDITISGGAVTNNSALINTNGSGDNLLFGHANTEYRGAIGAYNSAGTLYNAFYAYHSTTTNTFKRTSSSNRPGWLEFPTTGGFTYKLGSVGTVATDITSPTSLFALTPTAFTLDSSVTATISKFSGSPSFNGNLIYIGPESALSGNGGQVRFRGDTSAVNWLLGHGGSVGATSFILYDLINSKQPFSVALNAADGGFAIGASSNTMSQSLNVTGAITSTSTNTSAGLNILTAPDTDGISFKTSGGTLRWVIRPTTAETGSGNTGSDLEFLGRADDGSGLDTWFKLYRANGKAYFKSSQSDAFSVGANGPANPAFKVDSSLASSATGIKVASAAAGSGVSVTVISSGTNEALNLSGKGTGNVSILNSALALTNVAVTAASGSTTTLDLSIGNIRTVTMPAGNTTLTASNVPVGVVIIHVIQDSVGSRLVTWNSLFKWAGGTAPTLTTTASARDVFTFSCDGSNCYNTESKLDVR